MWNEARRQHDGWPGVLDVLGRERGESLGDGLSGRERDGNSLGREDLMGHGGSGRESLGSRELCREVWLERGGGGQVLEILDVLDVFGGGVGQSLEGRVASGKSEARSGELEVFKNDRWSFIGRTLDGLGLFEDFEFRLGKNELGWG